MSVILDPDVFNNKAPYHLRRRLLAAASRCSLTIINPGNWIEMRDRSDAKRLAEAVIAEVRSSDDGCTFNLTESVLWELCTFEKDD